MNRTAFSVIALLSASLAAVQAFASASPSVGIIQEIQGSVSLTRAGEVLRGVDIGDSIENFDLIKTGADGAVVIALDSASGMAGTLIVRPLSAFTVKTDALRGGPATEGDILSGSVGVKVKKLSGDPSLRVRTGNTVMGVRGTEFEVQVSVNDGLLVTCSEGAVRCSGDSGDELDSVPGYAVERRAGERLRRVPVAVSSLADFRSRWYAEEISAFRGAPVQALDQYAASYLRMRDDFRAASAALSAEPAVAQWKAERRNLLVPSARDPLVMRQKSAVAGRLMAVRRVLFLFERIYYRLDEISLYVPETQRRARLSNGRTVDEFLRMVKADIGELERRTAEYRFVLSLYAERNEGREPISMESNSDSFFDSDDSFFD